jgi:hypothetical protein
LLRLLRGRDSGLGDSRMQCLRLVVWQRRDGLGGSAGIGGGERLPRTQLGRA